MKRRDLAILIGVGVIAAMISFFASSIIFGGKHAKTKVPTAETISTSFPDVKNDPTLTYIFYSGALDPAQPVPVVNSQGNQNTQPFNGPSQ